MGHKLGDETYYEVLGVPQTVGQDEIRQAYKAALLAAHPDKTGSSSAKSCSGTATTEVGSGTATTEVGSGTATTEVGSGHRRESCSDQKNSVHLDHATQFQVHANEHTGTRLAKIREAYGVLREEKSRLQYDRQLSVVAMFRGGQEPDDDIELNDMTISKEDDGEEIMYNHQCRCGDWYSLRECDVETLKQTVTLSHALIPCPSCSLVLGVRVPQ